MQRNFRTLHIPQRVYQHVNHNETV